MRNSAHNVRTGQHAATVASLEAPTPEEFVDF